MEVAAAKQLLPMARGPNSPSSSTSSSSPSSAASPSPRQPPSPRPVPRIIDTTPFPTTFVQADTANFKQVVQRLTGSDTPSSAQNKPAKSHHHHHHNHGGASGLAGGPKKPAFKLYERRIGKNNLKMIAPLAMAAAAAAGASPRKAGPEVLSPSVLDFPSLALGSPVTPLVSDPFNRSPASASPGEEEDAAERAAIARKGFFLHPSPRGAERPRLLPLFPVTSPRMAPSAAAAAPSSQ
ncbi:DNA-binding WRKY [Panicum miliaceum]|uniref:DNA-binding WRKY n=1 Tax=Panicum miliaceum TaxID=4540 RepID=A0A3L6R4U5_PANMI|nr:DNA-binding WRKY [Panicum miliaceum]